MIIKKRETAIMSIDEFNKLIEKTEYSICCDQDGDGWSWGIINDETKVKNPINDLVEKICIAKQIDEIDGISIVVTKYVSQKIVGDYSNIYVDETNDTVILLGE